MTKDSVLELVRQLDEPQKVVVAEWIEDFKQTNYTIPELLSSCMTDEVDNWYHENSEQFMRAWLDGYEIEKEKLYTVEIPNQKINKGPIAAIALVKNHSNEVQISVFIGAGDWKEDARSHLTESEIRKDFEWAWQWAEPVGEVEGVWN